jgi:hypothetical protein
MEEHERKQLRVFSFEQHIILSFTRGIHRTMKKLFALAAVLALALLVSASAFAGTFTLPKAGIEFTLPDSWQPSDSKLGTMFVSPAGDMVIFFGETNSEAGLDGAMEVVEQVVSEVLTDIELGEDTEHDVNGIQVFALEGTGKSDGADAFVSISILNAEGDSLGIMVSFGDAGADQKNAADLQALVGSLKIAQ